MPVLSVDKTAVAWTLQQIPDLLRADVEDDIKLEEAQKVVDSMAERMLVKDEKSNTRAKMPLVQEQQWLI